MKLRLLLHLLERLAPAALAESWDRVGLLVGRADKPIRRALLCIDLTEAVLGEAIKEKVDLVVAYHPPIFQPLDSLTDGPTKQRIILSAAEAKIAIYSPHTALDAAVGGVNDFLASAVGAGDVQPIRPAGGGAGGGSLKLVTFVPADAVDVVRVALAAAGAGRIGHYSDCSFSVAGQGTFRGDATTHPAVGGAGRFETVPELRLEMVVPADNLDAAIAALRQAHPYEEPAFDVYPLQQGSTLPVGTGAGQGRTVELSRAISLTTLIGRIKKALGVKQLEVARPSGGQRIKRVGVCAGAGGSLLCEAGPLDAFVTGEMRHHAILAAVAQNTAVLLAGHTQTERPYLKVYRRRIIATGGDAVKWLISRADRAPTSLR